MITGDFVNGLHLMVGLSTDNKPAQTSENTFLLEEDTGKAYYFSNGDWYEAGEGASLLINAILGGGRDLPVVSESDDGKVLGVEDGEWGLVESGADPEAIAQAVADWLDENITEPTEPIVDASLSVDGAAADALVTGKIFTDEAKYALLACLANVAWATADGQDYYDALESALFPVRVLSSITANYLQDRPIYTDDSLALVRLDLVVTANYSDGTTETLADDAYELTGTLTAGTSTITVSYGGKTADVTVTVTAPLYSVPDFAEQTVSSSGTAKVSKTNGVYTLEGTASGDVFILPNGTVSTSKSNTTWFSSIVGKPMQNAVYEIDWVNPNAIDATFKVKLAQSDATGNLAQAEFAMTANGSGQGGTTEYYNAAYGYERHYSCLALQFLRSSGSGAWSSSLSVSFKVRIFVDGVRYL